MEDLFEDQDSVFLVTKYMVGTVKEFYNWIWTEQVELSNEEFLDWALYMIAKMYQNVGILHSKYIMHFDIDPLNFFIGSDGEVYGGDLGSAENINPKGGYSDYNLEIIGSDVSNIEKGNRYYHCPEMLYRELQSTTKSTIKNRISSACDLFSLGKVALVLLNVKRVGGKKLIKFESVSVKDFMTKEQFVKDIAKMKQYIDDVVLLGALNENQKKFLLNIKEHSLNLNPLERNGPAILEGVNMAYFEKYKPQIVEALSDFEDTYLESEPLAKTVECTKGNFQDLTEAINEVRALPSNPFTKLQNSALSKQKPEVQSKLPVIDKTTVKDSLVKASVRRRRGRANKRKAKTNRRSK